MEGAQSAVQLPEVIAGVAGLDFNVADFGKGATYLGLGVIVGLLAKKYLRLVITSCIVAAVLLKGLEAREIIAVDWPGMRDFVGLETSATVESVFNMAVDWFKAQSFIAISSIMGFLIGYKAG